MYLEKHNQIVRIAYDKNLFGTFKNQKITGIVQYKGYIYGLWKGKRVGTWRLSADKWFVV